MDFRHGRLCPIFTIGNKTIVLNFSFKDHSSQFFFKSLISKHIQIENLLLIMHVLILYRMKEKKWLYIFLGGGGEMFLINFFK